MKVALIHDWFTTLGGSEVVIKNIHSLFPDADFFAIVAKTTTLEKLSIDPKKVTTSFIQKLPYALNKYRSYFPLFPIAIEQFDLSEYDLIISCSHAAAKGVITNSNQVHICYCHSPIRYAWDLYHQYLKESGLDRGLKGLIAKFFLHRIRMWDIISANRVDYFISNSNYIGRRIKKIYGRESVTIYPGVAVNDFPLVTKKEDFYFTCSRLVQYKRIDLIVEAFNEMPDKKLVVIGDGPDLKKIKNLAKSNITILGYQPFSVLRDYMSRAKAFVFAAEEDFGIVKIEAQACGTPVIAFQKGGAIETVIENVTGIFFKAQTIESLKTAVFNFQNHSFDSAIIKNHSTKFSTDRFNKEFSNFVDAILKERKII